MRRKYAKAGEKIKIITPNLFVRVGYPLTPEIVMETHREEVERLVSIASRAIQGTPPAGLLDTEPYLTPRANQLLTMAVCSFILNRERFGGPDRKIYEKLEPSLLDKVVTVTEKHFVKTGKYYGPSGGYSYWGEYDYEPGGLKDEKTHCVYSIDIGCMIVPLTTTGVKIVATNCELINGNG